MKLLLLAAALAFPAATHVALADDAAATAPRDDGGARLVPLVRDGKADGFKVYAIVPGGRFAAMKFENGDTILKVDGESVVTDKGAALLRDAVVAGKADARVDIVRRGAPMVLATTKR